MAFICKLDNRYRWTNKKEKNHIPNAETTSRIIQICVDPGLAKKNTLHVL